MNFHSTREVAKKLGIPYTTLATYIAVGKVPGPKTNISGTSAQIWTEEEIESIRQLLPKIANGRKTRYKKAQAKAPMPHKKKRTKKKKETR